MVKRLFLLALLILSVGGIHAQEVSKSVQRADRVFGDGNYDKALDLYLRAASEEAVTAHLARQIGSCYRFQGDMAQAEIWYEKALQQPDHNSSDYLLLGYAQKANGKVELAVRVECNSVGASDTRGAMAWVPEKHDRKSDCDKLASEVLNAYVEATELPLRDFKGESVISKTDETFLNKTNAPVCTLFIGHISNSAEDKKINDAEFQKTMAKGIVTGILKYLGVSQ